MSFLLLPDLSFFLQEFSFFLSFSLSVFIRFSYHKPRAILLAMRISCLSTLGLVGASFAAPHAFVLHEKRESIPSNWIKKDRAPADAELSIQSDIDLGQDPSTDPASPQFGKYVYTDLEN